MPNAKGKGEFSLGVCNRHQSVRLYFQRAVQYLLPKLVFLQNPSPAEDLLNPELPLNNSGT